jgi:hypothetical protein
MEIVNIVILENKVLSEIISFPFENLTTQEIEMLWDDINDRFTKLISPSIREEYDPDVEEIEEYIATALENGYYEDGNRMEYMISYSTEIVKTRFNSKFQ